MRPVEADGLAEGAEHRDDGGQVVGAVLGETVRGAEAGQVDGDHLALAGEDVEHRLPGLPVVPDAVEEQQRFPRAPPLVRQGRRTGTRRGLDRERDPCGHAGSLRLLRRLVS
ncbi:hypothetical protein GCM10017674_31680 [Streptomyces gardneri]|uniref:Uncharacterized protein n=1 Tax=Streptomyces gardneri TaxID=66892 RepID=A0A4Y3RGI3_9ACTN|nr:hypothetical protein SGA01_05050 [Streptomyces gardneri]GHG98037.1 hypothetical protein GCM10017674_31680 [Streptomyces gardneri]